jgi:hypothetical protein
VPLAALCRRLARAEPPAACRGGALRLLTPHASRRGPQVAVQRLPGQGRGLVARSRLGKGELLLRVPMGLVVSEASALEGAVPAVCAAWIPPPVASRRVAVAPSPKLWKSAVSRYAAPKPSLSRRRARPNPPLTRTSKKKGSPLLRRLVGGRGLPSWTVLALWLAEQRALGGGGAWAPYLSVLPERSGTVLDWREGEVRSFGGAGGIARQWGCAGGGGGARVWAGRQGSGQGAEADALHTGSTGMGCMGQYCGASLRGVRC